MRRFIPFALLTLIPDVAGLQKKYSTMAAQELILLKGSGDLKHNEMKLLDKELASRGVTEDVVKMIVKDVGEDASRNVWSLSQSKIAKCIGLFLLAWVAAFVGKKMAHILNPLYVGVPVLVGYIWWRRKRSRPK